MTRRILAAGAVIAGATLGWCAAAAAVELGECAPAQGGAYSDKACTVSAPPGAKKGYDWVELTLPGAEYRDGHEWVVDEPVDIDSETSNFAIHCRASEPFGQVTGFTTVREYLRFRFCEQTAPEHATCGSGPENTVFTEETTGTIGEDHEGPTITTALEATFACGSNLVTIEGTYTGIYTNRKGASKVIVNTPGSKAYVHSGFGIGSEFLTGTLNGTPLGAMLLTDEREERFGGTHGVEGEVVKPDKRVELREL